MNRLDRKAKELEERYDKIKNNFIISQKDVAIIEFFRSIRCSICGQVPRRINKNYRVMGDIYCQDCYWKIMGRRKEEETRK